MRRAAAAAIVLLAGAAGLILFAWTPWESQGTAAVCPPQRPHGPARLDLRRTLGRDAPFLRRFDYRAMYTSAAVDAIPSIDRPCFEPSADAAPLLPDSSLVIGVERGGEAHAYPVDLLSLHEVVNDVVGGEPIAVTWCPLCASAVGYDRRVGEKTLTFGVSGYLYQANLMMFDRETGSLWSQLLGGAATGRHRGRTLRRVPLVHETWGRWRAEHPDTLVLSIRRDALGRRFTDPYAYSSSGEQDSNVPYSWYATKLPVYRPRTVRGVDDASRVYSVLLAGTAKAYPIPDLRGEGLVEDTVAGQPLVVVPNNGALSAAVYSRRVGERVLTFSRRGGTLVDRETSTRWSAATGWAFSGPLAGRALGRLPAVSAYWFAWRRFFPETEVWRPAG
jgi:Protein of unknown function (DUF3179)